MDCITRKIAVALLVLGMIASVSGCEKKTEGPTPKPQVVTPQTVCSEQLNTWVTVTGSGFSPSPKDGLTDKPLLALPQLSINKTLQLNGTAAAGAPVVLNADVTDTTVSRVHWTSQSEMSFLVDQTPPLESGIYDLNAQNPTGGKGTLPQALVVVPPPALTGVEPLETCASPLQTTLTLTGTGFLVLDGEMPTVTVTTGATAVNATAAAMVDSACEAIYGLTNSYICTQITATLPAGTVASDGIYTVSLTNPGTAACTSPTTVDFIVVPPPVVSAIEPEELCSAQLDTTITLTGTGFLVRDGVTPTVTITVGATAVNATQVAMVDGACQPFHGLTNWYVCTQITATLSAGSMVDEGIYTVSVTNPGSAGCATATTAQFTVVAAPLVFSLDPPAVYNGISIRETIYVSGLDQAPQGVTLSPTGGGTATALTNVVWDAANPNVVTATVPAGLAAGTYDVIIVNDGCDAVLAGQFTVVDTPTMALLNPAVEPPFGLEQTAVPVNIVAKEDGDLATGEVNFSPTPRVYISNATMTEAVPVRAVTFDSSSQLSAVIPELPAGQYDVTVVNIVPGGATTVGFAQNAYRATTVAPPTVEEVSPTLIGTESGQQVTVKGQNFNNPVVSLECMDGTTPPATIASASMTSLDATIDGSQLSTGVTCVVRVTNSVDATWDEWSAISAANPAANIEPFIAGENMNTPRRAPALAFGSATRKARFLYAIGGDDGTAAGAMTSVEVASQGRFGGINEWRTLQTTLPAGRTMARAKRYDNFIYHMGGMDASDVVTGEILRAEILNPLNVPFIDDVDISFDPEGGLNGLSPGAWSYAVAPVYASTDTSNPGGEGLPSETFNLYTPNVPGGVYVSLSWATVLGADGVTPAVQYRVYRTTAADQVSSEMRLLATVDAVAGDSQSYADENPAMADTTKAPLRTGALGEWHPTGTALNTPRAAFAFTDASETGCSDRWIAFGGITDAATESDTYEVIDPATMMATEFTATGLSARRETAIWVANNENSTTALLGACEYYLYVGPGASGALATPTDEVNAFVAQVTNTATGEVDVFADAIGSGSQPSLFGYDAFWSGAKVYSMGGDAGSGASNVVNDGEWSAEPVMQNLNSASQPLTQARYLFGFARHGAFAYLAGGVDDLGAVTATTEYNVR